jgi:hypothetical protein
LPNSDISPHIHHSSRSQGGTTLATRSKGDKSQGAAPTISVDAKSEGVHVHVRRPALRPASSCDSFFTSYEQMAKYQNYDMSTASVDVEGQLETKTDAL